MTQSSVAHDLSALATVHAARSQPPTILPIGSSAGGAGVTSVLAGLGRALSIMGEEVLLVDAKTPSTLDYFFARESADSTLLISTQPVSSFEGQVHVLRTDALASGALQSWPTRLHRAVGELRGRCDRILVAGRDALTQTVMQQAAASGVCLVVVNADLRSVLAAGAILQTFSRASGASGQEIKPAFLINGFDESDAAHRQNRDLLTAELGQHLLPFCIPRSQILAEALAHRTNPIDAAPRSAFTEACFNLAEWYRMTTSIAKRQTSSVEENQLVSE